MKRSISSRSSPMSCCHSLSRSIQSSNVAMRRHGAPSQLYVTDFLTIRENIVILVRRWRRLSSRIRRHGRAATPRLIFTLYGDMVHRPAGDGSLWIGGLVRLMAPFGISEAAVRQAVSRMSRQGWLAARRQGKRAFYAVTAARPPPDRRAEPAHLRAGRRVGRPLADARLQRRRGAARSSATGSARNSPCSAGLRSRRRPGSRRPTASPRREPRPKRRRTAPTVDLFVARYAGPQTDRELLERCWDVAAIAARIPGVHTQYRTRLECANASGGRSDGRGGVRRAALARPRLPEIRLPRPGTSERAAAARIGPARRPRWSFASITPLWRQNRCAIFGQPEAER